MELKIGDQAPLFTLYDSERNEVSLSDYRGSNVLLLFFPLAFSGGCTKELCQIRDDQTIYDGLDANIIGISVDSIFALDRFKKDQSYNFPLLSDFNKDVARSYSALYESFVLGMKEVAKRSAFVIDKEGIIKYAEVLENAGDMPNFDSIKGVLKDIS